MARLAQLVLTRLNVTFVHREPPAACLRHRLDLFQRFTISVEVEDRRRAGLLVHRLKAAAGIGVKGIRRQGLVEDFRYFKSEACIESFGTVEFLDP